MVVGGSCHHATKETNGSARQERQSSVCPAAKLAKEDTTASALCLSNLEQFEGNKARAQEASQCAVSGSTLTHTGVFYAASSSGTQSTTSPQARHSL